MSFARNLQLCRRLAGIDKTQRYCIRKLHPRRFSFTSPFRDPERKVLDQDASQSATVRPRPSRFAAAKEDDSDLSSFKRQRIEDMREDQQSEEPLYPEPYPRLKSSPAWKSVPDFLKDFHGRLSNEPITLTGRVRSKRIAGKSLIFLDIVNEFQRVQVMINKKKCITGSRTRLQKLALLKQLIQVGDHISVTGVAVRSETGETTLEATEIPELLSPSMEQIPDKLTDPKARIEHRHLDMLVNREVVDVLRLRAAITQYMRDHLHSKRFLEFQTPILAENAGGAVARPFTTQASEIRKKSLAMRIAPELWLKRLVVGGIDRVFEIGPSFRNEGVDATHNPEFTMCEFYSAYSNLADLINETEEIIYRLAQRSQELIAEELKTLPSIDLSRFVRPFKQVEFVPALQEALGIRLPKLSTDGALAELLAVLKLAGITVPGEVPDTLPKLLDRLATIYLEPLSFSEPLFLTNHPACMSPLAKSFLCGTTYQLVSARAELFIGGREIANMYEEENNPEEQRTKLATHQRLVNISDGEVGIDPDAAVAEQEDAEDKGEEATPLDQSFVRALDYALPPTGGWGCGVERLVMLFSGANRISDCLSFGSLRNVVGLTADGKSTSAPPASGVQSEGGGDGGS